MLVADRDIMIFNHRIMTFGDELSNIVDDCYRCEKPIIFLSDEPVKIQNIEIETLSLIPYKENSNCFLWVSKNNKFRILFKFLTVKENYELQEYEKQFDYSSVEKFSKIIIEINEDKNISSILYENNIPLRILREFEKFYDSHVPYIKLISSPIICSNCGADNTIKGFIDTNILPINNIKIKEYSLEEYGFIHKRLHLSHNELYEMPIENRKKIFKQQVAEFKKENEKPVNNPVLKH